MKLEDLTTIEQLREFLSGTQAVAFSVIRGKDDGYRWIQQERGKFHYLTLSRHRKGVVIRYLMKISGYSRQQLARLIAQYPKTGRLQRRQRTVAGFKQKYTEHDIRLLAAMDECHDTPCGPAIKKRCERAYEIFGQTEYASLATISVSHLYNLRKSTAYTRRRRHFEKTRPRVSKIGERYLIPALEQLLQTFPFSVRGFTLTTARNTSTNGAPHCWRSCASSSPSPIPGSRMTMLWQKAKTVPWSESCSATATSHNADQGLQSAALEPLSQLPPPLLLPGNPHRQQGQTTQNLPL